MADWEFGTTFSSDWKLDPNPMETRSNVCEDGCFWADTLQKIP